MLGGMESVRGQRPMKVAAVVCVALLVGCGPAGTAPSAPALEPLPVQQARVYGETVTGRFVSLIDFENTPLGRPGARTATEWGDAQLGHFSIHPAGDGHVAHVANVTRTGTGAMAVELPAGSSLRFRPPQVRNFSRYTLLSLAVHSPAVRGDLTITLLSASGRWRSAGLLAPAGWNTITLDLARVARSGAFDLTRIEAVELHFASAAEAVSFNIDDIMLIDNRRQIKGIPATIKLLKSGLNYGISLPGWDGPILLTQGDDGLWRLGRHQPVVALRGPAGPAGEGEDLRAMGPRRVGAVELLEVNPVRLRLANTWYFPPQAGRWIDMDIRQIRWEYTFYGDGRWVTHVTVNNAGGDDLAGLRITNPTPAAWSTGQIGRGLAVDEFVGPVGVWSMLTAPLGAAGDRQKDQFIHPAAMTVRLGRGDAWADGDGNRDGFDESQGCYFARAAGGNCRIELTPPAGAALLRPVIRVAGPWAGAVTANCAGMPLRPLARVPGGVAVVVPGELAAPRVIEFAGPVGILDE